jgi:hypothetical protein
MEILLQLQWQKMRDKRLCSVRQKHLVASNQTQQFLIIGEK